MLVCCKLNVPAQLEVSYQTPEVVATFHPLTEPVHLTVGRSYIVYALSIRQSSPWYYVADDTYDGKLYPVAFPSAFFSIVDNRLSRQWVFALRPDAKTVNVLIGSREWIGDCSFYERLVDGDTETVERFNRQKATLDLEFPSSLASKSAVNMDGCWLMCPACGQAWESRSRSGLVRCPACNDVLLNPHYSEV